MLLTRFIRSILPNSFVHFILNSASSCHVLRTILVKNLLREEENQDERKRERVLERETYRSR
ncbi:unnamed protein product [Spirodela intermedia]|uniref:Uncharacterized protein n=1 Tax=Spirodela intermedia TaxID=51605 RepID=A0ABN7ECF6_SPIIN|nr:unnamed protein product [Spirodela intermedia]